MSKAADYKNAKALKDLNVHLHNFVKELSSASSRAAERTVKRLDERIQAAVKENFWYPGGVQRLVKITTVKKGDSVTSTSLGYKFAPVSLSRYPMRQVRVTTGKRKLSVRKGGGAADSPGNKFSRSITGDDAVIVTEYKLRKKGGGWIRVEGRKNYKFGGFLHTGRKRGEVGTLGQTNSFYSKVFERSQKQTWDGKTRAPIHALYGASFVALIRSSKVSWLYKDKNIFDSFAEDLFSADFKW